MSELDPRLADLLRRSPPPAALDEAHRAAVHAAARQAWFRQQAQRRRMNLGFAAAACLMAALAGWGLRAGLEVPEKATQPVVAIHQADERSVGAAAAMAPAPAAAPVVTALAEQHEDGARRDAGPARQRAAGLDRPKDMEAGNAMPPPAPAAAAESAMAGAMAAAPAAPAAFAAADAMAAEAKEEAPRAELRAAAKSAPAPTMVAARTAGPAPISIPANAPERGRLLAAAAVLDAAINHRLAADDRLPALQTALASLDGIAHPAADDLRRRLRNALLRP